MGRFEKIALQVSALPLDRQDVIADAITKVFDDGLATWSLLTDEQAEIVSLRMAKPFGADCATDDEVAAVFAPLHD